MRGKKKSGLGSKDADAGSNSQTVPRSEEHTSELQSRQYLVCRLLLEKKVPIRSHGLLTVSTIVIVILLIISTRPTSSSATMLVTPKSYYETSQVHSHHYLL